VLRYSRLPSGLAGLARQAPTPVASGLSSPAHLQDRTVVVLCACGASQMTDVVCTFCKKTVGPEGKVREGEKLFHLDCYLLDKRARGSRAPRRIPLR
jgi:hypothetical protein